MNYRKGMLAASVVSALFVTGTVFASPGIEDANNSAAAQQAGTQSQTNGQHGAAQKKVKDLKGITVTGYRGSLEKALDIKRNANSIVDAITAEDVGKFPDNNVAESLSHLPGITVDRTFGEGERISILGTDPALNRLLLNGQTLASTNWAGDPDNPDSRSFDYTVLSPEIIGTAEVYKTPQARIDEGSIGGTVIVNTRRPLDLKANTITGTVSYGYNANASRGKPNASLLYSWKNADHTFGVLGSVMHDDHLVDRQGTEVFGYQRTYDPSDANSMLGRGSNTHVFPTTLVPAGTQVKYPTSVNTAWFQQERKRDGVSGAVQWKPSDRFELNLTGLYSQDKLNNFNQSRYAYWGDNAPDAIAATIRNGLMTGASYDANAPTHLDGYYRNSKVRTGSLNLRADWHGDGWDASSQIGYTTSRGGSDGIYLLSFKTLAPYSYSLDGHNPLANYQVPGTDTSAAKLDAQGLNFAPSYDKERYAQFDFTKDVVWGPVDQILVGIKATNHYNGQTDYNAQLPATDTSLNLAQFAGGNTPSNFLDGLGSTSTMANWTTINSSALTSYVNSLPGAHTLILQKNGTYGIQEHTRAAYLQANFDGSRYHGNIGVRYAYTRDSVSGYSFNAGDPSIGVASYYSPLNKISSYADWLPSLNFSYDFTDELIGRFAAAKTIARPRYQDMTPYFATQDVSLTASGGNPNLKPYKSTNLDGSLEWYFKPGSLVSAELFYRRISQYILHETVIEPLYNNTLRQVDNYQVSMPINGSSAKVKGISLTYQGDIWNGFGLYANYTYSDASTGNADFSLPYNSKNSFNITPYYEKGAWSARINYSWRSAYFTQIGSIGAKQMAAAYKQLDASVSYQIDPHFSVSLQGSNLLNSTYYAYDGSPNNPLNTYKNGRVYMASMHFKF